MKYFINRGSWLTVFTGTISAGGAGGGGGGGGWDATWEVESCPGNGGGGGGGGGAAGIVDSLVLVLFVVWTLLFELLSFSNFKFLISSTEFNFYFNISLHNKLGKKITTITILTFVSNKVSELSNDSNLVFNWASLDSHFVAKLFKNVQVLTKNTFI